MPSNQAIGDYRTLPAQSNRPLSIMAKTSHARTVDAPLLRGAPPPSPLEIMHAMVLNAGTKALCIEFVIGPIPTHNQPNFGFPQNQKLV